MNYALDALWWRLTDPQCAQPSRHPHRAAFVAQRLRIAAARIAG